MFQKEDECTNPMGVSDRGIVDIEKENEVQKVENEELDKPLEGNIENVISEPEKVDIVKREKELTTPNESSDSGNVVIEKEAYELEAESHTHESEASYTADYGTSPEEVPGILETTYGIKDIGMTQEASATKDDFKVYVREQTIEESPEEKKEDEERYKEVFEITKEVPNTTEETIKETTIVKDVSFNEETTRESSQEDKVCEKTETDGATENAEKRIIEESVVTGLSTSVGEVTTEGSIKEAETAEVTLDKQVKDSDSEFTERSFEAPCSTVEIVPEILNQANLTKDLASLSTRDTSEGETLSKESNEKLVESSYVVYEVSEKEIKEEILKSAETVTSDFHLASPAVVTEVARLKEVEPEANIISKETSSLDENADEEIVTRSKHKVDDTLETKCEDQTEVAIGKASLEDISEENLEQSSIQASKEDEVEASKIIDRDPLEEQNHNETPDTPCIAQTTEEIMIQNEDESTNPMGLTDRETVDIEKENEDQKVENEELDKLLEGKTENDIFELEKVDIKEREKGVTTPGESSNSGNVVIKKEVDELEAESHTREREASYTINYGTSPEKNYELVDRGMLEPVHQGQSNETSETQIQDENKDVQNLETVSVEERVIEQRFQEGEKEIEEKVKPKSEVKDHENKIENSNETIIKSVLTEEMSEVVEKIDEGENIKDGRKDDQDWETTSADEQVIEQRFKEREKKIDEVLDPKLEAEEHGNKIQDANETPIQAVLSEEMSEELHTVPKEDETVTQVEHSDLVSSEDTTAAHSNENAEVSPLTTLEKNVLLQEGGERFVNVSAIEVGVSEEKIKEDSLDQIDKGHVKLDDITVDEKPVEASRIASEDQCGKTIETCETKLYNESFGSVKLEETSDLVAQSTNTEREITVKEVVMQEKKHTDELDKENKEAAETSESRHQEALPADNTEEKLQEPFFVVAESTTTSEKIENGRKETEAEENDTVENSKVTETTELACLQKEEPRELEFSELGLAENIQGERSNEAPKEEGTTVDETSISDHQETVTETKYVDELESEKTTKLATQIESNSHEKTLDLRVIPPAEGIFPEGAVEKCDEALDIELDNSSKALESVSEATTELKVEEKQLVEANEITDRISNEETSEEVNRGNKDEKEKITEDENNSTELHTVSIEDKKVENSTLVSTENAKVTSSNESTETVSLKGDKDLQMELDSPPLTKIPDEETIQREGSHESEEKIEGDILEEADKKYDKFDEKHLDENPIEAIGIGSEDRGPETFELTDTKLQGEQLQPVKLEENSDLVSQLPLIESENDDKEFVVVERSHVDEVEEIKKSEIPETNLDDSLGAKAIEETCLPKGETRELEVSELKIGENINKESPNEESVEQGMNVGGTSISEPQDHVTCVENPLERETITEQQRPILGNSEQTPKDEENLPITPSIEETSSQEGCKEVSNLEFEKTEKALESVSIFHNHEELIKPDKTEIEKDLHQTTATGLVTKESQYENRVEDNETINNEISNEQVPEEKEVEKVSHILSRSEERIKESQQDELHVEEYLGEKTRKISLVANDGIQSEELSEKLAKDEERSTEDVEEPRQVSVDYETVKESLTEETKEVKHDEEKAIKSDPENKGDETNCSGAATEATTPVDEDHGSDLVMVKHELDTRNDGNKETVTITAEEEPNTNIVVPITTNAEVEETPVGKGGDGIEGISENLPMVHETSKVYEKNKELQATYLDDSDSLVGDDNFKHTSTESTSNLSDLTEGFNLKDQDAYSNKPERLHDLTLEEKKTAEVNIPTTIGGESIGDEEVHAKDKVPVEIATTETERRLIETDSAICANEDEETRYRREKRGVLPHIHDSGIETKRREGPVVHELSHGITEEHFTETMISSANKAVPLLVQDPIEKTIQKDEVEVQEVGASRIESEVKGIGFGGKTRTGDAEEGTTEEAMSHEKLSLYELLQRSTKNTLQMEGHLTEEKEPTGKKEEPQIEVEETGPRDHHHDHDHDHDDHDEEAKTDEEEEGDEHRKADLGSDAPVMVEATKDIDVKVAHKKSHGILSGVGSKVKHSLAKVKKAITGKSSHSKTQHESPKAIPES